MKSCVPYGKYILVVFVLGKIQEIVMFLMVNSMVSLFRIRCGNFFVFVVDGVRINSWKWQKCKKLLSSNKKKSV